MTTRKATRSVFRDEGETRGRSGGGMQWRQRGVGGGGCYQEVQQQSRGGRGEDREGTSPTSQITSLTAGKTQLWHTDRQSQTQGAAGAGGEKKIEEEEEEEEGGEEKKQAAVQDPLLLGPPGASPVGYPPDEVDPLSG